MANGPQAAARRMRMADRAQQMMDVHFPGVPDAWLWRRKKNDGFTTIPRTLPIAMQAIDMQSKGQPAGHALFCLWARSPDHPLVTIENPAIFAAEAGFMGERAVDTWRRRMKRLRELNFIAPKSGASGEFHYVLLLNPNAAMEWMRASGMVQDHLYGRFIDRVAEVGAMADLEAARTYFAMQQAQAVAAAAVQPTGTPVTAIVTSSDTSSSATMQP